MNCYSLDVEREAARQLLAEYGAADINNHAVMIEAYAALRSSLGHVLEALDAERQVKDTRKGESTPALGEFIQCSAKGCPRGEWSAKAEERGWVRRGDGWLCVQCADAAEERAEIVARMAATVELSDGTVTLSDWSLVELLPDYYGNAYMQLDGWLPEDHELTVAHGTNHLLSVNLPGRAAPVHDVDVTVESKGYGTLRRFMKIQWLAAQYPEGWRDVLRTTGKLPDPVGQTSPDPEPADELTVRRQQLLDAIRRTPAIHWTTGTAAQVYADLGYPKRGRRHNSRNDLHVLAALGHVTVHGPDHARHFLYAQPEDGAQ